MSRPRLSRGSSNGSAISTISQTPRAMRSQISDLWAGMTPGGDRSCKSGRTNYTGGRELRKGSSQMISLDGEFADVGPEYWGITVKQFRQLIDECRQDPRWRRSNSVRDLVADYVKPQTAGTGRGYALLKNQDEPREIDILISHSWNENAEEFLETLERSVRPNEGLFICALSLFQCNDGSGPSIAEQIGNDLDSDPFHIVLAHIRTRGDLAGWRWWPVSNPNVVPYTLCVIGLAMLILAFSETEDVLQNRTSEFDRVWKPAEKMLVVTGTLLLMASLCIYLLTRCVEIYNGRMLAVANREDDLYSRLWCVYEIYSAAVVQRVPVALGHNFASIGTSGTSEAQCSSEDDARRIRGEIEAGMGVKASKSAKDGYDMVDHCIYSTKRRNAVVSFFRFVFVGAVALSVNPAIKNFEALWPQLIGSWISMFVWFGVMFWTGNRCQGKFRMRDFVLTTLVYLAIFMISYVIGFILWPSLLPGETCTDINCYGDLTWYHISALSYAREALPLVFFFQVPFFISLVVSQCLVGLRGPWRAISVAMMMFWGIACMLSGNLFGNISWGNDDALYRCAHIVIQYGVRAPLMYLYFAWMFIHWGFEWDGGTGRCCSCCKRERRPAEPTKEALDEETGDADIDIKQVPSETSGIDVRSETSLEECMSQQRPQVNIGEHACKAAPKLVYFDGQDNPRPVILGHIVPRQMNFEEHPSTKVNIGEHECKPAPKIVYFDGESSLEQMASRKYDIEL